jgi:hypothetical protein
MIFAFRENEKNRFRFNPTPQGGVPRGLGPLTPDTPSNEFTFLPQDEWSLVSKIAIASLSSQVGRRTGYSANTR